MSQKELQKYQAVVSTPPSVGCILRTYDESPAVLTVHTEDKKPPFIFGRAYINELLGTELGWYLRGLDDDKSIGWKCVLMTRARRDVVKQCGDQLASGMILVNALRVVRPSESGNSLLCEVAEYCEPLVPPPDDVPSDSEEDCIQEVNLNILEN